MFDWSSVCAKRPAVMGVINVTPDSFSDGGRHLALDAAVAHGLELVADGADLLDVGGESTRPGAEPVTADEERRRVVPVVERLAAEAGVPVSVDTTKSVVAIDALAAGAAIVNDVSAGRFDAALLGVVADSGAGYVLMHMRGEPRSMQDDPQYADVVTDVGDALAGYLDGARAAGITDSALAVDPGIGFGKTVEHNLALLARVDELVARFPVPVLVGTSRKRFIGSVLADVGLDGEPGPDARAEGTLATVVWAMERGASIVRVHETADAARAARLVGSLRAAA